MNYTDYLHDTSHAVIEGALLAAAARGIACEATLRGIVDGSSPFNRDDRRAQRIWHDELHHQLGAKRRQSAVEWGEARGGAGRAGRRWSAGGSRPRPTTTFPVRRAGRQLLGS